jgi:hypothetical protein
MPAPEATSAAITQDPPPVAILKMLAGRWVSAAVAVAARLDLADALANGPRTSAEIAAGRDLHAPSLYRLLRVLGSLGIVAEDHDGRFALTELGQFLRSDVPGSMRGMARWFASEEHGAAWNALGYSVRSGDAAFDHVYGRNFWSYLEREPVLSATFGEAMTSTMSSMRDEIAAALPLDGARTIADIGGAHGALLANVLAERPSLRGILYERADVIAVAERNADVVLRERCTFAAGDFLERAPRADVHVLSWVLHDWSDADCVRILANCRAALEPGGRVAIVDFVIEPGNGEEFAKLLDLEMLVITSGGRERTRTDFEGILARAGLRLDRATRLQSGPCLIEAVPS